MSYSFLKVIIFVPVNTSMDILQYPIHRLKLFESGVYNSGLKLYNMLSDNLKEVSIEKLKTDLKYTLFTVYV